MTKWLEIVAPTDEDVRFILQAIADEMRYCHERPGTDESRRIGFTEAAWMLEEYLRGELTPGDFDCEEVFQRLLKHYGWEDPRE